MTVADFALDGVTPRRVVRATAIEDVVEAIREANATGLAVVAVGGATRLAVGDAPARYDIAIDLTAYQGVVEHEPGDLTATVHAGTTLGSLHERLARHGQRWPVEVATADRATVGGVVAGAAVGPSRLRFAHPRDWIVGVVAVLGNGSLARAGGKVVKNVTGYDLTRLYAGSYGTLCVLLELNLRLWPLPAAERTLVASFADPAEGDAALARLRRDRVDIDAAVSLDRGAARLLGGESALCVVRASGARPTVDRVLDEVARALSAGRPEEAAPGIWPRIAELPQRTVIVARVVAPESRIAEIMRGAGPGLLRYAGTGTAYVLTEEAEPTRLRSLRSAAEAAGGACILERAPAALRRAVGTWGRSDLTGALAGRIKRALDPNGVLSPGRIPVSS